MSVNSVRYLGTGADDTALALKIYSGVFNEAYRNQPKLFNSSLPCIHRTTVSGAKSYQFLMMAETPDPEAEYTPGSDLLGQDYAVDEGTVTVDKYIVAHHYIPRDQMRIGHFEILPRLARADARKIGLTGDKRLFTTAALAARAAAVTKNSLAVHSGGNRVTRTGGTVAAAYPRSATGAANFRADLRQLARQMDEDNVPAEDRYMWITPYMREVLLYDTTAQVFSKDYINGENNQQKREIMLIEGFKLVDYVNTTTNGGSLPDENIATGPSKYQGNFTVQASNGTPVALVLCASADGGAAVSMGTWEAVQNEVTYMPEKLSWLVASYVLAGIGQMNPWCAGSVEVIT